MNANSKTSERFKDAGDCPIRSVEIQGPSNEAPFAPQVGKLWLGAEWIDVAQARLLRDWLNEVIP